MIPVIKNIPHYFRRVPIKLKLVYQSLRGPYFKCVPPGHFYSPLPDLEEIDRRSTRIYGPVPRSLAGIDLRTDKQLQLLGEFENYYLGLPFDREFNPKSRFYRSNRSFPFQDAFTLYAMIRHFRPERLIEIGCGSSSSVSLDSVEALHLKTKFTFIDPFPEFFLSLVRPEDSARFELRRQIIQDVPPDLFMTLEAGDILFVDSSHVSKVGSDVNFIFFEILPLLKKGVVIHFHDIFYPFEYALKRLREGIFWSEAYLLRSFLMFNENFEILIFNDYLNQIIPDRMNSRFPRCMEQPGASIWLRRV